MLAEYRGSQLMDVLKSFGCARPAKDEDMTSPSGGDEDNDDPYDGTAEEAMAEVEDEVNKAVREGYEPKRSVGPGVHGEYRPFRDGEAPHREQGGCVISGGGVIIRGPSMPGRRSASHP
jgi:hypothetical protein